MILTAIDKINFKYMFNVDDYTIYTNFIPTNEINYSFSLVNDNIDSILAPLFDKNMLRFILLNCTPIAILLVGSRAQLLIDEYSDYDLCIIVDDDNYIDCSKNCCICTNDYKIHWYCRPFADFIAVDKYVIIKKYDLLTINGFCQLKYGKVLAIFDKQKYDTALSTFNDWFDLASKYFIYRLYDNLIYKCISANSIIIGTKLLYYLCVLSHIIEGTNFNIPLLLELKRIKNFGISDKCQSYCLARLNYINSYYWTQFNSKLER